MYNLPSETSSMQTQGSIIASSASGSITSPYDRSLHLKNTSFPRSHLMAKPGSDAETYTASLCMLGHGIPLWEPVGNLERPTEQLNSGISIGDVGFLDREGSFRCYFNLFLPPEHPAQSFCPPDLIPLDPASQSDISNNPTKFPRGTALVSQGIEVSTDASSPSDIKFTVKSREGGILVLPDGATREDLLSTSRVRDYVREHALNWYVFFREGLGAVVHPNGTLYVVTGTDKAATWASCVTSASQRRLRQLWKPSTITYQGARDGSPHYWKSDQRANKQFAYKRSREIDHVGGCALFIRGMRFAVNVRDWTQHVLDYKPPEEIPFYVIRTTPNFGFRAKVQTLKECRPGYQQRVPAVDDGVCIRIMFHPLDIILQWLLEMVPDSTMACVEDQLWCSVVDMKNDADLTTISRLLIHILKTYDVSTQNEMVTLVPHENPKNQMSPAFPKSWLRLSQYIKQRYGTWSHYRRTSLGDIFPGSRVPTEILVSTRQDELS